MGDNNSKWNNWQRLISKIYKQLKQLNTRKIIMIYLYVLPSHHLIETLLPYFLLFFVKLFFFNWKIISLQYFGDYCHVLTWITHGCSCVTPSWTCPPPSPSHHSGLFQSTGFMCPVSCLELALVIYFTYCNIYVSMVFSQITPPSPSPTEYENLFFTSVSLLLPCI